MNRIESKINRESIMLYVNIIKAKENRLIDNFIGNNLKNAVPKIKGEITKGKIRRRGIALNTTVEYPKKVWLTQRGKKISETLIIKLPDDLSIVPVSYY